MCYSSETQCIYEKSGPYPEYFMKGLINDGLFEMLQPYVWGAIVTHMRTWDTCKEFPDILEKIIPQVTPMHKKAFEFDPDEFNVLLHGDMWANNIMILEDEHGQAKDALFVDWQIARYGSPVQDLFYFIFSSTEHSLKVKEFDYFLRYYHTELIKNLKLLQYLKPLPTLVDLHISAIKRGFYGVTVALGVMAGALLSPNKNISLQAYFNESENSRKMKESLYNNERFKASCQIILPFLRHRGGLEF